MSNQKQPKFRVWWIPQVPMEPFRVQVSTLKAGVILMRILADYDRFQFEKNVKGDYCNVGGIEVWNPASKLWEDWYDEETGEEDPTRYLEAQKERSKDGKK